MHNCFFAIVNVIEGLPLFSPLRKPGVFLQMDGCQAFEFPFSVLAGTGLQAELLFCRQSHQPRDTIHNQSQNLQSLPQSQDPQGHQPGSRQQPRTNSVCICMCH